MRIKYNIIVEESEALKAVEQDGYALRYVKEQTEVFSRIATEFGIEIEL